MSSPRPRKRWRRVLAIVVLVLSGWLGVRMLRHAFSDERLRVITLPAGGRRSVNSLVPEWLGATLAARVLNLPR